MGIKVSVIIPVYNVESYLRPCLDSVLEQNLREIEVLCVDDCSSDHSTDILTEYALKDRRITVIRNSANQGAGQCRNLGIESARGEYCFFLDADDWLAKGSLEKVYREACRTRADILRCRAFDYDNQTGVIFRTKHNALKHVPFFLFGRALDGTRIYPVLAKICVAPWGGLVRRELLIEQQIRFNRLHCVNDRSFFWETALKARRIVFSGKTLVYYRTNLANSLVGGRVRNFACHFTSYELVEALCAGLPPRMQRRILDAELFDLANWLEQSNGTAYAERNCVLVRQFVETMDRSPWRGDIMRRRWYRRILKALREEPKEKHTRGC
ncbi:MAG: glycosyltransferase family 2 protein [Clostridiaceae bacterium]|nr:glycosyltransferase family 2 protein [Clostridiaceae bacterium]